MNFPVYLQFTIMAHFPYDMTSFLFKPRDKVLNELINCYIPGPSRIMWLNCQKSSWWRGAARVRVNWSVTPSTTRTWCTTESPVFGMSCPRKTPRWVADPRENCHLTVKKLPKTWHFFQKKWQKCQVFGNLLTVKWQFSRGSATHLVD